MMTDIASIQPLMYPIPGMVMMTESLNFVISVISVSIVVKLQEKIKSP